MTAGNELPKGHLPAGEHGAHAEWAPEGIRREVSLRSLFRAGVVGLCITDGLGAITSANALFLSMVGRSREDLPLGLAEITAPTSLELVRASLEECQATGNSSSSKWELQRPDGRAVPVVTGLVRLAADTPRHLALFVDMSEQRRAESALRASESRYRSLFEKIPLMYFSLDPAGIVRSVNERGAQELGCGRHELVGKPFSRIFDPEDRPKLETRLRKTLVEPDAVARWEFRARRKDGSLLWARTAARVVASGGGGREILVVCEDVTERRQAQQRLAELNDALSRAEDEAYRRIAAVLHDDVAQTLAMARNEAGRLAREGGDSGEALAGLCRLLDRSIEATRTLSFDLSPPMLLDLGLAKALEALAERLERRTGLRVELVVEPSWQPPREEEAIVLYRVVRELLINVTKHAQTSRARVALAASAEARRIEVEDGGVGFDAERPAEEHRGLGLFHARQRLQRLGGSLTIDSAPGAGSRLVLRAPRRETPPSRPTTKAAR